MQDFQMRKINVNGSSEWLMTQVYTQQTNEKKN